MVSLFTDNTLLLIALPIPEDRGIEIEAEDETPRQEVLQTYTDSIISPLFNCTDTNLHTFPRQIVFGERITFARMLKKSFEILTAGQFEHCLLLTVDSLLDEETLDLLAEDKALLTSDTPTGFIPGEWAAALLLSSTSQGTPFQAKVAIDLDEINFEEEDETVLDDAILKSWQGRKLLHCLKEVYPAKEDTGYFPHVISDFNGQELRASEYGSLQAQIQKNYPNLSWLPDRIPATSFGELSNLSGAIALAIAVAGIERRYAQTRETIILLSEISGKRAAINIRF